ncbi:hypothetical protein FB45DRAFT_1051070 [Roridomyces roridus]|uniref:Uncharacterized protein n=1 Tax=Roridomyces roridus TaxID=1738132 RepID=A0AAD7CL55_9AGAR|nr:hypothetical protein FB45DRAFT_1051070 [Roridomyces roridus]
MNSSRPQLTHTGVDDMDPRIPLDLERAIFELVALSHPVHIPNLLLVASRIKTWLQPLLYRTVVVNCDPPRVDGLRSYRPELFFQIAELHRPFLDSVRNLMLADANDEEMARILSACSHVQNLYIGWPLDRSPSDASLGALNALPLRHLYCDTRYVLYQDGPFSQPSLANISHLELFDEVPEVEHWSKLVELPRLTHLCTGDYDAHFSAFALEKCEFLHVLVVTMSPRPSWDYSDVAKDSRFVMMKMLSGLVEDWQRGALHGDDYWARAEDFIAKRRAGLSRPDRSILFILHRTFLRILSRYFYGSIPNEIHIPQSSSGDQSGGMRWSDAMDMGGVVLASF